MPFDQRPRISDKPMLQSSEEVVVSTISLSLLIPNGSKHSLRVLPARKGLEG
jgi:hypothetical protein